jgi:hypothetical protein
MNAQLTLSTDKVFDLQYSTEAGSLRREISRGINLPQELRIKHRTVTDTKTGLKSQQDLMQFDRIMLLSSGLYAPVRVKLTVESPVDSGVASADVLATVEFVAQMIQEDDGGVNLADDMFVKKLQ